MGGVASNRRRASVFPTGGNWDNRASVITRASVTSEISVPETEVDTADIKSHLCGADPITTRGKQIQMVQMLTIPMVPALLLMIHSAIYLSETIGARNNVTRAVDKLAVIAELTELGSILQEERMALTLFSLKNQTDNGWFEPLQKINETDKLIKNVNPWPEVFENSNFTHDWLRSREDLVNILNEKRDEISLFKIRPQDILVIYDTLISSILRIVDNLIRGINVGGIWRSVVGHVNLLKGQESLHVLVIIGEAIYRERFIPSPRLLRKFIAGDVIATDFIKTARLLSSAIQKHYSDVSEIMPDPTPSSQIVKLHIRNEFVGTLQGKRYLNNTYEYLTMLRAIEKASADDKLHLARNELKSADNGVAGSIVFLMLTVILTPTVFVLLTKMIRAVQNYVQGLYKKGLQIRRNKKKSDDLLYQMLPKSVALQLKVMKRTTPEGFRSVTIFFSDIVGFTALSSRSTPLEVVDVLNKMYNLFDSTIAKYDVFKVETIGDAYMVASGVPQRNGMRHAGEIAQLSLDLVEGIRTFRIPSKPDEKLRVRVGIHTGSVVAGVVGAKMPRYCLFGDTVSYASLMESQGVPMKIQLSPATNNILSELGSYLVESRGVVVVTGYGESETFFLRGRVKTIESHRM